MRRFWPAAIGSNHAPRCACVARKRTPLAQSISPPRGGGWLKRRCRLLVFAWKVAAGWPFESSLAVALSVRPLCHAITSGPVLFLLLSFSCFLPFFSLARSNAGVLRSTKCVWHIMSDLRPKSATCDVCMHRSSCAEHCAQRRLLLRRHAERPSRPRNALHVRSTHCDWRRSAEFYFCGRRCRIAFRFILRPTRGHCVRPPARKATKQAAGSS